MKHAFTKSKWLSRAFALAAVSLPSLASGQATDLFFSEYVEGSSFNKCIEIFNGTGAPVDLAANGYTLNISFNGGSGTASIPLSGTIADGDVYVLCDDGATAAFLAEADQTTSTSLWNGDDALSLVKSGGTVVDIFGEIGNDPGSAWTDGPATTANRTLIRFPNITAGVSTNPTGLGFATLAAEWNVFVQDYAFDLGQHTYNPVTPPVVDLGPDIVACAGETVVLDAGPDGDLYIWETGGTGQFESITETGSYEVEVINAGGSVIDRVHVRFLETNIAIDPFEQTICPGTFATMTTQVYTTDLIISQYVEGSGLNKCVELYNGTANAIDLGAEDYRINIVFNGGSFTSSIPLSGVVAAGDVFVLCDDDASAAHLANVDQTTSTSLWNGDDAVYLNKNGGEVVDIVGVIGQDPGTQWTDGSAGTRDGSLTRNANVLNGVDLNPDVAGPAGFETLSSEWTYVAGGGATGLGAHTFTPGGSYLWNTYQTTASITRNPIAANQYVVTYTDVTGCEATTNAFVYVHDQPTASITGNTTVYPAYAPLACTDLTANATGGVGPYTYEWGVTANNATTQTVNVCPTASVSTGYGVRITDANGCQDTEVATVYSVDVSCGNNGNKILVCHNGHEICINANAVAAHLAHGDELGPCPKSNDGTYTKPQAHASSAPSLSLSPNPSAGETRIRFTSEADATARVEVMDAFGKTVALVYNGTVSHGEVYSFDFNGSELANGMYFVRLVIGGEQQIEKLILAH